MAECLSRVQQARKKKVISRGATASIAPGGDGFACPASGCKSVFDTAEEALEHGATHGLSGEREVDDEGKSCCLWQGCGKKIKVDMRWVEPKFPKLQIHEALHVKGPKPREGFVCPECDEAYPTSAAAWACAATHDVEEDPRKCLWAGCGLAFRVPALYREHEPVRVRPPAHGGVASRAIAARAAAPPLHPRALPLSASPLTPDPPRRVAEAHGTLLVPLHHVQEGLRGLECALRPATPLRSPPTRPLTPRLPLAARATLCCKVTGACKCGWTQKGHNGARNFKLHKQSCSRGAAPELLG
eukprot:scaffold44372_cov58-Phaeocystis_antarctica.AAC.5